jgi:hypothetical protein
MMICERGARVGSVTRKRKRLPPSSLVNKCVHVYVWKTRPIKMKPIWVVIKLLQPLSCRKKGESVNVILVFGRGERRQKKQAKGGERARSLWRAASRGKRGGKVNGAESETTEGWSKQKHAYQN